MMGIIFLLALISVAVHGRIISNFDLSSSGLLAAVSPSEGIITSHDFGETWMQTPAPMIAWTGVAVAGNGQYLGAVAAKHGLYVSTDSGNNWRKAAVAGNSNDWKSIKLSASGRYALACTDKLVYRSEDFGYTWQTAFEVSGNWQAISMSKNGQYVMVVGLTEGAYRSEDFGKTWTTTGVAVGSWSDVECDEYGEKWTLIGLGEGIYTSTDYGKTFAKSNAPEFVWRAVSADPSGRYQVAAASGESIYTSSDYGSTWRSTKSAKKSWVNVDTAANGKIIYGLSDQDEKMIMSIDGGRTWTSSKVEVQKASSENLKKFLKGREDVQFLAQPSNQPSSQPTAAPTKFVPAFSSTPTENPTVVPSAAPTTASPSAVPTASPSHAPTQIPTQVPTCFPTMIPTAIPTEIPSKKPSAIPTLRPTAPTATPTSQTSDNLNVNANYTFANYTSNTMSGTDKQVMTLSIGSSLNNSDVSVNGYQTSGGHHRRLHLVVDHVTTEGVTYYTLIVDSTIVYDLVNYPGMSASAVYNLVNSQIQASITSGQLSNLVHSYALQLGATSMLNMTATGASSTYTVNSFSSSSSNNNNNLSGGDIAAIVICSVVGFVAIVAIIFYSLQRKRSGIYRNVGGVQKDVGSQEIQAAHEIINL